MNPADVQSWIDALGWSLVHFLWQGALVGALFALVRALLPREQSGARYASGLFALGVLALCPLVTFLTLRPRVDLAVDLAAAGAASAALPTATVDGGMWAGADVLLPWLVAAWGCGVAVMAARALLQWRGLERIASQLAWRQADLDDLLARVAARFGGLARAHVLVSRHIDTPTLIGWIHPVILLPASVALGFPRHQIELILAHELGHLRRYDHLVNLGQAVIETLLFYHPVVHWISREVRHEREVCCDNLVLRLTEEEPREYARTLAALEDLRQLPPQLAVAASGGRLLDRVRRILGAGPVTRGQQGRSRAHWVVALAVVGTLAVAAMAVRREPEVLLTLVAPASAEFTVIPLVLEPDIDLPVARVDLPALPLILRAPAAPPLVAASTAAPVVVAPRVDESFRAAPIDVDVASTGLPAAAVIEVADVEAAARAAAIAPPVARETRSRPNLVRRVDPVYPDVNVADSRGHVEFEFAITGDGHVRDISVVSGDSLGAFAVAARRALRQWRFAPHSAQARSGERFRQDFAFVGISRGTLSVDDSICPRDTGSHLCRPGRSFGVTTEVEVGSTEPTLPVASHDVRSTVDVGADVASASSPSSAPDSGISP